MNLGLEGKRALVTGASAGLGAATALALAAEGAVVTINGRNHERLRALGTRMLHETGAEPVLAVGDVSKPEDVAKIVDTAGRVDIFVSNAGGPPPGQFLDHAPERFSEAANLTLHSAVGMTRALLPGMRERGWGRVIFITSVGVLQPIDNLILSNIFRAGVTGFCKTLSNNYAKDGITFNCVCPGYTATERLLSLADTIAADTGQTREQVMEGFATTTPAGRVGQPEELAALIAFLSSDRAAFITGTSIPVDGGFHRSLL